MSETAHQRLARLAAARNAANAPAAAAATAAIAPALPAPTNPTPQPSTPVIPIQQPQAPAAPAAEDPRARLARLAQARQAQMSSTTTAIAPALPAAAAFPPPQSNNMMGIGGMGQPNQFSAPQPNPQPHQQSNFNNGSHGGFNRPGQGGQGGPGQWGGNNQQQQHQQPQRKGLSVIAMPNVGGLSAGVTGINPTGGFGNNNNNHHGGSGGGNGRWNNNNNNNTGGGGGYQNGDRGGYQGRGGRGGYHGHNNNRGNWGGNNQQQGNEQGGGMAHNNNQNEPHRPRRPAMVAVRFEKLPMWITYQDLYRQVQMEAKSALINAILDIASCTATCLIQGHGPAHAIVNRFNNTMSFGAIAPISVSIFESGAKSGGFIDFDNLGKGKLIKDSTEIPGDIDPHREYLIGQSLSDPLVLGQDLLDVFEKELNQKSVQFYGDIFPIAMGARGVVKKEFKGPWQQKGNDDGEGGNGGQQQHGDGEQMAG